MYQQAIALVGLAVTVGCHIPGAPPFSTGPALPNCGDHVLDPGEMCDDGSRNNDQWGECTEQCAIPICGDGLVHEPTEQCDPGSDDGVICFPDCTLPASCGDGIVHELESCDLGSENSTAEYGEPGGCSQLCNPIPYCGDGTLNETHEGCDDGNDNDNDACTNACQKNVCGDGILYEGYEDCDDANESNSDACLSDCTDARCGDGFVYEEMEECDGQTDCGPKCVTDRYVFVSELTWRGDLEQGVGATGIERADWLCLAHAQAAKLHLGKDFRAWISDDTSSPASRFFHSPGRYIMPDGTVFAESWDELVQLQIQSPLYMTENGGEPMQGTVWTNTLPDGTVGSVSQDCEGWSSKSIDVVGRTGVLQTTDARWTDWEPLYTTPCDIPKHLYCFEQ